MAGLAQDGMAWVPAGTFTMGSDRHYPEEAPTHRISVDGLWMDETAVTNAEFAVFVQDTGYRTIAERPLDPAGFPGARPENLVPGSLVFTPSSGPVDLRHLNRWWTWTPGACWHRPWGPHSDIHGLNDHPVVHVAYEDAETYASWAGKELPTEAEWERAARGGLEGAEYAWGDDQLPRGEYPANWYQGNFPWRPDPADGFELTAPVRSFPPNPFGLYELTGNTWEWTADWYVERRPNDSDESCCVTQNPRGGRPEQSYDPEQPQFLVPRKVIKGGSFLCADDYCKRYRPAARRPQMVDTGMSHIGFRCVARPMAPTVSSSRQPSS
jgi:formylglycine-generating enzyme required for sulfatase activity